MPLSENIHTDLMEKTGLATLLVIFVLCLHILINFLMPKRMEIVVLTKDFLGNILIFTIIPLSEILQNKSLSKFVFQLIAGIKINCDNTFFRFIRSCLSNSKNNKVQPIYFLQEIARVSVKWPFNPPVVTLSRVRRYISQ